jgi:gluconolactonase
VFYGKPDGSSVQVIARPVMTPNGIALSPDGRTLYYAETEGARVWSFEITAPGIVRKEGWPSPHGGHMLAAAPGGHYQRFDSMAVDAFGSICVATLIHGGISIISPDGRTTSHVPLPDRFTTNICFGGKDLRTAYVTLSGSGKLIAIEDWPVPGLELNHPA